MDHICNWSCYHDIEKKCTPRDIKAAMKYFFLCVPKCATRIFRYIGRIPAPHDQWFLLHSPCEKKSTFPSFHRLLKAQPRSYKTISHGSGHGGAQSYAGQGFPQQGNLRFFRPFHFLKLVNLYFFKSTDPGSLNRFLVNEIKKPTNRAQSRGRVLFVLLLKQIDIYQELVLKLSYPNNFYPLF